MAKSIVFIEKRRGRGRPATFSTHVLTALRPELLADLDAWRGQQGDSPSRPEAIRRLLVQALSGRRRQQKV
jgi:hypothetical protein